jgi:hypothetical protein
MAEAENYNKTMEMLFWIIVRMTMNGILKTAGRSQAVEERSQLTVCDASCNSDIMQNDMLAQVTVC